MTQKTATYGRPRSEIDSKRLKQLRKDKGLTQLELATAVYKRAGKTLESSDALKNTAQRWEREGRIARNLIPHLALVLNTTTAVLGGAAPEPTPSRIDEIESQIKAQIENGTTPELTQALANHEGAESPIRELAESINRQLEMAQLSQDQVALKQLSALTGYSVRQLERPTSNWGFWVLVGTGPLGSGRSEIICGLDGVLYEVRKEIEDRLSKLDESDARVVFTREAHWFQVTMLRPRLPDWSLGLRFARCQPNERGLQWCSPTWQDKFLLDKLPNDTFSQANFVTGFDGALVPADCTNLRFAIVKRKPYKARQENDADTPSEIVALTSGNLADLHPDTLKSFKRDDCSHRLITQRISKNLWETLQPWMAEWPQNCWVFATAAYRIDIRLEVPFQLWANGIKPPEFGTQLSICLVEQSPDGKTIYAPWRQKDVERVYEELLLQRQKSDKSKS